MTFSARLSRCWSCFRENCFPAVDWPCADFDDGRPAADCEPVFSSGSLLGSSDGIVFALRHSASALNASSFAALSALAALGDTELAADVGCATLGPPFVSGAEAGFVAVDLSVSVSVGLVLAVSELDVSGFGGAAGASLETPLASPNRPSQWCRRCRLRSRKRAGQSSENRNQPAPRWVLPLAPEYQ